jgi:DNA repair exonuclease SbcCD ATPase subunit
MKITQLSAENVKRLTAVHVTPDPDGNLVIVGGNNAAGKSSVLDSIMYALAGTKAIPSQPIRNGARQAKIRIRLDGEKSLTVERVMKAKGGGLVVKAEGKAAPLSSPQAVLDSLCGKIAFDPLEFTRLKRRDQAERLRGLVGLDFTEHDKKRKETFDERTTVNRDAKAAQARLDAAPHYPDAPAEEVSVAELMEQLKRADETNRANDRERTGCEEAEKEVNAWNAGITEAQAAVVEAQRALLVAENELKHQLAGRDKALSEHAKLQERVAKLQNIDTAPIQHKVTASEETNRQVRANRDRLDLEGEVADLQDQAERLTEDIAQFDQQKQAQLEAANWPVPGLGFDEEGVTYNGLPFDQASQAEALQVSIAIGAALNPVLRVMLIRDGSLLDDESLATIAKLAEERDLQLWIERVGDGEECSVVIQDGRVREEEQEKQEAEA